MRLFRFLYFLKKRLSVPKLDEMLISLFFQLFSAFCRSHAPLPGPTTMWTRFVGTINFDLYPKSRQCFPLNRNVSIFVHPCRPSEPNHSLLLDNLHTIIFGFVLAAAPLFQHILGRILVLILTIRVESQGKTWLWGYSVLEQYLVNHSVIKERHASLS